MSNKFFRHLFISVILAIIIFISLSISALISNTINVPFIKIIQPKQEIWSIGLYKMHLNKSSLKIEPYNDIKNPIISAKNVTDRNASFTADPFIINHQGVYYLFFEVMGPDNGDIGVAISGDGIDWQYIKIVLDESFHLSYPYVFKNNGKFYMVPESNKADSIRLYEAQDFPYKWKFVKTLVSGRYCDTSIFKFDNKWWLLTSTGITLYLFYADRLEGPYYSHPKNPIYENNSLIGRNGGSIIFFDGRIIRTAQKDYPVYGKALKLLEIHKINTTEYEEVQIQEIANDDLGLANWNRDGIHHLSCIKLDNKNWICAIDGKKYTDSAYINIANIVKIKFPLQILRFKEKINELSYK